MDLPKKVTQIGVPNPDYKIYVEDYVYSYIKQLNQNASNKSIAVALYGRNEEINTKEYFFVYGACKIKSIERDMQTLGQTQLEEIHRLGEIHFPDMRFVGYKLLFGEAIEGYYIVNRNISKYINGYFLFYEKNDQMLTYMLNNKEDIKKEEAPKQDVKQKENKPESNIVSVKKREENIKEKNSKLYKACVAAVFAFVLYAGLKSMGESGRLDSIATYAGQILGEINESKIRDLSGSDADTEEREAVDQVVADPGLAEAVLNENTLDDINVTVNATEEENQNTTEMTEVTDTIETNGDSEATEIEETSEQDEQTESTEAAENSVDIAAETVNNEYVIQKNDTLIDISIRFYGSNKKVDEICKINNIDNPDDIKVGQKILLP